MENEYPTEDPSLDGFVREFCVFGVGNGPAQSSWFCTLPGFCTIDRKMDLLKSRSLRRTTMSILVSIIWDPIWPNLAMVFLGWNTRFRGNEPWFILEHALVDIAAGRELVA